MHRIHRKENRTRKRPDGPGVPATRASRASTRRERRLFGVTRWVAAILLAQKLVLLNEPREGYEIYDPLSIMSKNILFVAIGGMLGSVGRFVLVGLIVNLLPYTFPFGTFLVNILGCFVMGAVVGLAERHAGFHNEWRVFLTAGFCGGFTTFSAFAFENAQLLLDKSYGTFAIYSIASFVVCLAAALAGLMLFRS